MQKKSTASHSALFLGIEGGGTRTVALLVDSDGQLRDRREFGPGNFKLLTPPQLFRHLRTISKSFPKPDAVAIGLAGARGEAEWGQIREAAGRVWTGVPCHATHDLETAIAAAEIPVARGSRRTSGPSTGHLPPSAPRILILSGTGSCCYGLAPDGRAARFGGWGHLLGDKGSGYEIGLRALKAAVFYHDRDGTWSDLGRRILSTLLLNEPGDLIAWAQNATKKDIASLAAGVFAAASRRDAIARDILEGAASSLARDGAACARKLVKPGAPATFILAGGVLTQQPRFAREVSRELASHWPGATVTTLRHEGAWGAVALAERKFKGLRSESRAGRREPASTRNETGHGTPDPTPLTESRNPRSRHLDRLPVARAIELMLAEDAEILAALRTERAGIERAVRRIAAAFERGGRLFYVGAGTSGRLGVLDASECPPTFRSPPDMVQGVVAGGQQALWRAVEGAEDDAGAGARAMEFRGAGARDVVVGIAASGTTPFVHGALGAAKRRGAFTILLCFNPAMTARRPRPADLVIAPAVGPEVLTGSTRLKAGTATKLVLNIFTTLAMVRIGKVAGNLMVDLNPSNVKLRDRAVRIVSELTGADATRARQSLERSGWVVKKALRLARRRA